MLSPCFKRHAVDSHSFFRSTTDPYDPNNPILIEATKLIQEKPSELNLEQKQYYVRVFCFKSFFF